MKRCLEITDRLIRIKQEFEQLGTKFIKAGERLHVENILPSRDLLDELDTARENFDDLIRQMSKYAAELEEKIDIARFDSLLEIEKVWSNMIDERYEEKKMAMTDSMPSGENGKKTLHFQGNLEECLFSLLGEHKYGPAFWIAHYCKQKHGKTPVPPLLIKALELSRVIQGEDGPAASWLSIVYSDFEFYSYLDFEEKDQSDLVRKLLFLAALLRPAYVAPESGALSLIIKINLPGDLEKTQKLLTEWVGKEKRNEENKKKEKQQSIAQEAQDWLVRNKELHMASGVASNLWKKMQEPGAPLDNLLTPVIENDLLALEQVQSTIVYLKDEGNIKIEIAKLLEEPHPLKSSSEFFFVPGSWQILEHFREALNIAERWMRASEDVCTYKEAGKLTEKEIRHFVRIAREELIGFSYRYEEKQFLHTAIHHYKKALESFEQTPLKGHQKSLQGEELMQLETSISPQLKLKPLLKPEKEKVMRMGKAFLNLFDNQESNEAGFNGGQWNNQNENDNNPCEKQTVADELQSLLSQNYTETDDMYSKNLLPVETGGYLQSSLLRSDEDCIQKYGKHED